MKIIKITHEKGRDTIETDEGVLIHSDTGDGNITNLEYRKIMLDYYLETLGEDVFFKDFSAETMKKYKELYRENT